VPATWIVRNLPFSSPCRAWLGSCACAGQEIRVKVAIPRFGETVAPCFEYSATIAIFIVRGRKVVDQIDFCLQSREAFDRLRLLRDQGVNTLICGGVQAFFEDALVEIGISVISWVSGNVDDLLRRFLAGELVARDARQRGAGRTTAAAKERLPS
jgi:predicted Fe-Mo cluster-binding NifX family protein